MKGWYDYPGKPLVSTLAFTHALAFSFEFFLQARAAEVALTTSNEPVFNYKEWACSVGGSAPWEDNASPLTSRINTGVTFFRSNNGGRAMAKRWMKTMVKCLDGDNPGCDDQTSFNSGMRRGDRGPVLAADFSTVRIARLRFCITVLLKCAYHAEFSRRDLSSVGRAEFS